MKEFMNPVPLKTHNIKYKMKKRKSIILIYVREGKEWLFINIKETSTKKKVTIIWKNQNERNKMEKGKNNELLKDVQNKDDKKLWFKNNELQRRGQEKDMIFE